jgi:hypothetical protein
VFTGHWSGQLAERQLSDLPTGGNQHGAVFQRLLIQVSGSLYSKFRRFGRNQHRVVFHRFQMKSVEILGNRGGSCAGINDLLPRDMILREATFVASLFDVERGHSHCDRAEVCSEHAIQAGKANGMV